jgi:hypothetical protein
MLFPSYPGRLDRPPVSKFQKAPFALIYTAIVLFIAAIAATERVEPAYWFQFRSQLPNGFHVFRFAAWLIVPVLLCLGNYDAHWFGFKRWRRGDWRILLAAAILAIAALAVIPVFPELREFYPSLKKAPARIRLEYALYFLIWLISWLPALEFLHRYYLLRAVRFRWPRYGWLLVPLAEFLMHLEKFILEAFGMALLSLLITSWAVRRQNMLLPFLIHLIIELELLAFMLFI